MFLTCFCICGLGGIEDITAKEALLFSKRPEIPSLFEWKRKLYNWKMQKAGTRGEVSREMCVAKGGIKLFLSDISRV
jgi:hypothetical protein